jgi:hypothetical protein
MIWDYNKLLEALRSKQLYELFITNYIHKSNNIFARRNGIDKVIMNYYSPEYETMTITFQNREILFEGNSSNASFKVTLDTRSDFNTYVTSSVTYNAHFLITQE